MAAGLRLVEISTYVLLFSAVTLFGQDNPARATTRFGGMNPTFFLSPAKPRKLIWRAGPAIVIPTAASTVLGQGKLSIGPSIVALTQPGP
jgi:hypothetical protein